MIDLYEKLEGGVGDLSVEMMYLIGVHCLSPPLPSFTRISSRKIAQQIHTYT